MCQIDVLQRYDMLKVSKFICHNIGLHRDNVESIEINLRVEKIGNK